MRRLLLLLPALLGGATGATCPKECRCSSAGGGTAVDCAGLRPSRLKGLLRQLPPSTAVLALPKGAMTSMEDICCFPHLRQLDLSHNRLEAIVTYSSFPSLTHLNLQGNRLRIIRKDEFASFPELEVLNLEDNGIESLDSDAFRLLHLRELHLANNRLKYIHQRTFRWTPRLEVLSVGGNSLHQLLDRNFYFLSQLRSLDLSRNGMDSLPPSALQPLPSLEDLDLGHNNFSVLPQGIFRSLSALSALKLGGNPLHRLSSGVFGGLARLAELELSGLADLELVLAGTFAGLASLRRLDLGDCPRLAFLSPAAFQETPSLAWISLANSSLRALAPSLLALPSLRSLVLPQHLDCDCLRALQRSRGERLKAVGRPSPLSCIEASGSPALLNLASARHFSDASCRPRLLAVPSAPAPFLGAAFRLFCVQQTPFPRALAWRLPDGSALPPTGATPASRLRKAVYASFTPTYARRAERQEPILFRRAEGRPRREAGVESLRFAFLAPEDEGAYACSDGAGGSASVSVRLRRPSYGLWVRQVGAAFVTLHWNGTLREPSLSTRHLIKYRVQGEPEEMALWLLLPRGSLRSSQVVKRLSPLSNYTFCLLYQAGNRTLYSACAGATTGQPLLGVGGSLNAGLLLSLGVVAAAAALICLARCLHARFHVWQEAKYRSRMAESVSGQSFLSSSSVHSSARGWDNGRISARTIENFEAGSSSRPPSSRASHSRPQSSRHHQQHKSLPYYKSPEECEMDKL